MTSHPDVVEFRRFYSSELGLCARRDLSAAIARHWDDMADVTLAGVGFALPYLRRYLETSRYVLSLMVPHLGAIYWPADIANHSVLCDEGSLPLPDHSVGRVLVCHGLEHSQHTDRLMAELYRILLPGGRALFIVPNRRGIWSGAAQTPFGSGHPYTIQQLRQRGEPAGLTYIRASTALFYPPSGWRMVLRASRYVESIGHFLFPQQGGALLVEMEKQLYASIPEPVTTRGRALLKPAQG